MMALGFAMAAVAGGGIAVARRAIGKKRAKIIDDVRHCYGKFWQGNTADARGPGRLANTRPSKAQVVADDAGGHAVRAVAATEAETASTW